MKNKYHTLVLFLVFPLLTSVAAAQQKNTGINISAKEKQAQRIHRLQNELKWLNMETIRLAYEDMKRLE